MDTIWLEMLLIVVAILANGLFAGSEMALVSARPARLAQLRDQSTRGAAIALRLKGDPESFLAALQIAITLVALALRDPERAASWVAGPVQALMRAVAPVGRLLTRSTRAILALLGQREAPTAPLVSEEEVKYLVREGVARGVFEGQEGDLVHRILQFTDTPVRAVMGPRPKILALEFDTPPDEVLAQAAATGRTRLPVIRGSVDDTVGVIVIKDLLRAVAAHQPPRLADLLHPVQCVTETARVPVVLQALQRQHQNLAMVVDEYGRTSGLVTTEDLLEEIVGELRDEREPTGLPYLAPCRAVPISSTGRRRFTTSGSAWDSRSRSRPSIRRWRASCSTCSTPCRTRARR